MSETLTQKELDIAIGEQVMGWKRVWIRGWHGGAFIGGHYSTPEECQQACEKLHDPELHPVMLWSKDGNTWGAGEEWSPSTTWEGAGLVVERLSAEGWEMTVFHNPTDLSKIWDIRLFHPEKRPHRYVEHGKTFPETLAWCALLTKGKGDGD
jgi:hypothetical protein